EGVVLREVRAERLGAARVDVANGFRAPRVDRGDRGTVLLGDRPPGTRAVRLEVDVEHRRRDRAAARERRAGDPHVDPTRRGVQAVAGLVPGGLELVLP